MDSPMSSFKKLVAVLLNLFTSYKNLRQHEEIRKGLVEYAIHKRTQTLSNVRDTPTFQRITSSMAIFNKNLLAH